MKFLKAVGIFFLFLLRINSFAQQMNQQESYYQRDTVYGPKRLMGDEMVDQVFLPAVVIYAPFWSAADRAKFNRLRYNVLKVLPYAKYAKNRYAKLQQDLAVTGDSKEQKKLIKACDQQIKEMFNREVKNLTITQGGILIKLIDRETGYTSYDLLRELEGGFKAFFYQSIARVVGHNLKNDYNAHQERDIESIIAASPYRM